MKRFIFLIALLCQMVGVAVAQTVEDLGMDFGKRVYATQKNPKGTYALVMFRERNKKDTDWKQWGEIGLFDLRDKEMMWTEKFDYNTAVAWCTNRGVLVAKEGEMTMKDWYTGAPLWAGVGAPILLDEATGMLLSYGLAGSTKVHGLSLRDGAECWTARIPATRSWGWNQVLWEDSVHVVVVNDHVDRINIVTGETDTFEAKTGIADVGQIVATAAASVALTVVANVNNHSDYFYYYTPSSYPPKIIAELHSNLLQADTCYYFSDRNQVVKLDRRLRPVWTTPLPEKMGAHAVLYAHGPTVYMANLGYGLKGKGEHHATGRPFVAAFNAQTGEQQFLRHLSEGKCMADSAAFTPQGCTVFFPDSTSYTPF
ncbi:MAG: hypothetical protein IJ841_02320 [Prevotella sp.]|nr:hypothetical protein [Prevotella sp.]